MIKFILGAACGALVMAAIASTHPNQTKEVLRSGADHITSTVASGASAAQNAANQQFGSK